MRAVRLEKLGQTISMMETEDPALRPAGAIVRIEAAHVPGFMGKVLAGELAYYDMPVPFIPGPGAVGVVEEVADDVPWLQRGTRVFLDINLSSRLSGAPYDQILIGLTSMAPAGHKLQALWRNGTYAERVCYPAECLTPVGAAAENTTPAQLALLNFLCIAYGALLGGNLRPSQTVIVNGATGNLGACVVLCAVAMGASQVIALARDTDELNSLKELSSRVEPLQVKGDGQDQERIQKTAGVSGADLMVDALGNATTPEPTLAAIRGLRQGGTAVLCGGVLAPLAIPYMEVMVRELTIRGVFMYPRHAPAELLRMIASGTLDLDKTHVSSFALPQVQQALETASQLKGLNFCTICP